MIQGFVARTSRLRSAARGNFPRIPRDLFHIPSHRSQATKDYIDYRKRNLQILMALPKYAPAKVMPGKKTK